jgi:hypothetical protein
MKYSLPKYLFHAILVAPGASIFLSVILYFSAGTKAMLTCQTIDPPRERMSCIDKEMKKIPAWIDLSALVIPYAGLIALEALFAVRYFTQKKAVEEVPILGEIIETIKSE